MQCTIKPRISTRVFRVQVWHRIVYYILKNTMKNITSHLSEDIHDSRADEQRLQPETVTLDLPDVRDIPGQEHVTVPELGELADTTISSADEEGDELFDDANELDEDDDDEDGDVSDEEAELLERSATETPEDEDELDVDEASLDDVDEDGDPLEEASLKDDRFGEDLDLPELEEIDEEDTLMEEEDADDDL